MAFLFALTAIPGATHEVTLGNVLLRDSGYAALTVRLFVSYTGNGSVRDVSVTLDVPDCARCAAASFVVPPLPLSVRPKSPPNISSARMLRSKM